MKRFLSGLIALLLIASPVAAAFSVNQLSGFGAKASAAAAVTTFLDTATSTADSASYNLASVTLPGATGRHVVVCVFSSGGTTPTVTGVTVDGVTANQSVVAAQDFGRTYLYIATSTANATGTVSVTTSGTSNRMGIVVWGVQNLLSATATNTASDTGDDPSNTIDVSAGGAAFGCVYNATATAGHTWTGLTEVADTTIETTSYGGANADFATAQVALAVSVTLTGGTNTGLALASFR